MSIPRALSGAAETLECGDFLVVEILYYLLSPEDI